MSLRPIVGKAVLLLIGAICGALSGTLLGKHMLTEEYRIAFQCPGGTTMSVFWGREGAGDSPRDHTLASGLKGNGTITPDHPFKHERVCFYHERGQSKCAVQVKYRPRNRVLALVGMGFEERDSVLESRDRSLDAALEAEGDRGYQHTRQCSSLVFRPDADQDATRPPASVR